MSTPEMAGTLFKQHLNNIFGDLTTMKKQLRIEKEKFLTFPECFQIPIIFSNLNYN